jgi:hypothetical protein
MRHHETVEAEGPVAWGDARRAEAEPSVVEFMTDAGVVIRVLRQDGQEMPSRRLSP